MLLVVARQRAAYTGLVERFGAGDVEFAAGIGEARDRLERWDPTALVVGSSVDDVFGLVEDVRAGRFDRPSLPIVAVTDDGDRARELGVDETVPTSVDPGDLVAAVERAVLLGQYKAAVNEFFDVCRERAHGAGSTEGSHSARRTADAALEAIQDRDDAVPLESLIDGD